MEQLAYYREDGSTFPKDWQTKSIGSICEIFGRIGFRGYTKADIVKEHEGVIALSPSNIQDSKLHLNNCTYISWFKYHESPEIKIYNGDILLVKTGSTFGKTAIVRNLEKEATLNPQIVVLKKIKISNDYLGYLMQFNIFQNQINATVVGGAIPTLSQKQVSNFQIHLPPTLTEQKAIAQVLSDTDALIQALEKKIAKKKLIKKGVMQKLLTPKEGWVEKILGETATLKARIGWQGLTTSEYLNSGDYILITGTDFKNGFIDWDNCFYVDYERYKQDKNIQIKRNDILVTKDGTIGKVAFIKREHLPATLNSGVFVIRPIDNSFYPEYFYYILMSSHFNEYLNQLVAGSTITHLYQKDFIHYKFSVPPTINEQKQIAQTLSDIDSEIEQLEQKLAKYHKAKQGMMQQLLTGKIRLNHDFKD